MIAKKSKFMTALLKNIENKVAQGNISIDFPKIPNVADGKKIGVSKYFCIIIIRRTINYYTFLPNLKYLCTFHINFLRE